jgi:hypothetical protein
VREIFARVYNARIPRCVIYEERFTSRTQTIAIRYYGTIFFHIVFTYLFAVHAHNIITLARVGPPYLL